jgi:hypothetical protein
MARCVGLLGLTGLTLLGSAYWLTYEPAPRIRVLWREGIPPLQRATLERKYLLVNGRDAIAEGSLAYDLLDTRLSNIKALVDDPAVEDTNDIERHTYVIPFDVEYGIAWMWIAHRTPLLRDARVRRVVVAALTMMALAGGASPGWRMWWRRARRHHGGS